MTSVAETRRNRRIWKEALRAAGILPEARERSGRRQRAGGAEAIRRAKEAEDAAVSVVAEARCRQLGWKPTTENKRKALDMKRGFKLGSLFLDGVFGDLEGDQPRRRFEAGCKYAASDQAYRNAMGLPPRTAQGPSYGAVRGGGDDLDPERLRMEKAAHEAAQDVLRGAGPYARSSVEAVLDDDPPLSAVGLRDGLDALARHYGV